MSGKSDLTRRSVYEKVKAISWRWWLFIAVYPAMTLLVQKRRAEVEYGIDIHADWRDDVALVVVAVAVVSIVHNIAEWLKNGPDEGGS